MHGLTGRRVLATRSAERAAGKVALLEERGAVAVLLPTIRATPLADRTLLHQAMRRVSEYHWLVFTSVTAVNVVFDALAECNALPLPLDLRIAAIGDVTAAAAARRGAEVHAVPSVLAGVDSIAFTSPSTVHGLARATEGEMPRAVGKAVASIGPTTSAAVRDYFLPVHVEPELQTVASMVNDLDAYFVAKGRHSS